MNELIILSTNIFTGNRDNPFAQAVYIKNNRFEAVGSNDMIKKYINANAKVMELPGRLVTPGLIDAHCHFTERGFCSQNVNLFEARSLAECRELVREAVLIAAPGEWIIGSGWDSNKWKEKREPTVRDLDDISANNPVCLFRVCWHSMWVNSKAIKMSHKKNVCQGSLEKKNKKATADMGSGSVMQANMQLVLDSLPRPTKGQIKRAALAAQDEMLRLGITCVHSLEDLEAYKAIKELDHEGKLKIRIYHALHVDDIQGAEKESLGIHQGSEHLWFGHVKLFADGSFGANTALLHEPYADQPTNVGIAYLDRKSLQTGIEFAYERGLGVMIHAIGDKAVTNSLEAIAAARKKNPCQPRDRLEHVQLFRREDLKLFKDFNITASVQPAFLAADMQIIEKKLGKRRFANSYAWKTLMDEGIPLQFGSDAPVESADPLKGMLISIERTDNQRNSTKKWFPEQSLSLEEALTAYTNQAAFTSGKENDLGSIVPGKLADLTVFNQDLFHVSMNSWNEIAVELTIVDGRIIYAQKAKSGYVC